MDLEDLYDSRNENRKEYSVETVCAIAAPENEISEIIEKITEAYPMVQIDAKDFWCTIKIPTDRRDEAFDKANNVIEKINATYSEIYIEPINPWDD